MPPQQRPLSPHSAYNKATGRRCSIWYYKSQIWCLLCGKSEKLLKCPGQMWLTSESCMRRVTSFTSLSPPLQQNKESVAAGCQVEAEDAVPCRCICNLCFYSTFLSNVHWESPSGKKWKLAPFRQCQNMSLDHHLCHSMMFHSTASFETSSVSVKVLWTQMLWQGLHLDINDIKGFW